MALRMAIRGCLYIGCLLMLFLYQAGYLSPAVGLERAASAASASSAPVSQTAPGPITAHARAGCFTGEWCIESMPLAVQAPRKVLAIATGQSAWAVGPHGYVERRNGEEWSAIDCGTFADLNAAWGSTPDDVWLFGDSGETVHWDGQRCAPVNSGTDDDLQSAWGSGSNNIWAVSKERTVLHFDGARWTATKLAETVHHDVLNEVRIFGTGPSDVWVVGEVMLGTKLAESPLWHWDGATWQLVPVTLGRPKESGKSSPDGSPVQLTSIWASGPGDIWLAGIAIPHIERGSALILRGGTAGWRKMSMPSQPDGISHYNVNVLGNGPKDAWQIVTGGNEPDCSTYWACEHWNGKHWRDDDTCPLREGQEKYSWTAASNIWSLEKRGEISHWNGRTWQMSHEPREFKPRALVSRAPHDLFLLGTQQTSDNEPEESVLLHWDGRAWSQPTSIVERRLEALWGSGDALWAVGERGEIQHYDGHDWSGVEQNDEHNLHGVWGSSPSDLWAVGDAGTILHFRGKGWVAEAPAGSDRDLHAVWGSGPRDVWAVGSGGTLLHFDGNRFQRIATGTTNELLVIDGSSADDVWIGGSSGTLLHFTRAGMQALEISGQTQPGPSLNQPGGRVSRKPVTSDIIALKSRRANELWVATGTTSARGNQNPTLWRWNGAVWSPAVHADRYRGIPAITKLVSSGKEELWALDPYAALYRYRPTAPLSP